MLALEFAAFWLSGKWVGAGSGAVPVVSGSGIQPPGQPHYKSWNINAADGDTLIVFPHGFLTETFQIPVTPDSIRVCAPIPSVALAALANWGVTADTTNIYLAKQPATGSGGTPAMKIVAENPHSFIR